MRALLFKKHGGPEVLEEAYVPIPDLAKNDVLVRVKACALNHLDLWTLGGIPGTKISMPHILGCDVAGEVIEKGKKARGVPLHQPVIVAPGISCGKCIYCKTHWDSLCPRYHILGFQENGGYAEYVKVPARNIIPVDHHLSMEEWASIPLTFLTAWHMLVKRAGIKKRDSVLVHAAGSGVGSAAIQITRLFKAHVLTTVGSSEKVKPAEGLGADKVILYKEKDFASEVMRLTKGQGVDIVFDHIGGETFTKSISCLKKKGRLIACGVTTGRIPSIDLRYLYTRQLSILGSYMGSIYELEKIIRRVKAGKLRPVVDKVFPLREARQALNRMIARENFGKIILKP